jgi:hypothetical protein
MPALCPQTRMAAREALRPFLAEQGKAHGISAELAAAFKKTGFHEFVVSTILTITLCVRKRTLQSLRMQQKFL